MFDTLLALIAALASVVATLGFGAARHYRRQADEADARAAAADARARLNETVARNRDAAHAAARAEWMKIEEDLHADARHQLDRP